MNWISNCNPTRVTPVLFLAVLGHELNVMPWKTHVLQVRNHSNELATQLFLGPLDAVFWNRFLSTFQLLKCLYYPKDMQNRLKWAEDNWKVDFLNVFFTNEARATLVGLDSWSKRWVVNERDCSDRLRHQQGGGSIMIRAGIIGGIMHGSSESPLLYKNDCRHMRRTFHFSYVLCTQQLQ